MIAIFVNVGESIRTMLEANAILRRRHYGDVHLYKEILHHDDYFCALKRVLVGESDRNQEKQTVNVTAGHGIGPPYKHVKLKKVHVGESDENPAGHLIGEKSGYDVGPTYEHGKQIRDEKPTVNLTRDKSVCDGCPDKSHEESILKLNEEKSGHNDVLIHSYKSVKKVCVATCIPLLCLVCLVCR